MRQLLLLCQSPDDVKALPAAYSVVKAHYDACWMLFSPACLVDTAAESAQHEENLRRLDEAVIRCSTSRDFEGAKNYQQQLEAARIDQVMKVKEAWKTLTEEQRTEATKRVFGAFVNPAPVGNFRHEMLVDHYEPAQFIDALNSKKKTWFAPCVPGTFTIDWVSNLAKRAAKMFHRLQRHRLAQLLPLPHPRQRQSPRLFRPHQFNPRWPQSLLQRTGLILRLGPPSPGATP
jgi:hypothetical protein